MKYLKLYENSSKYIYLVIELFLSDNKYYVIRTTKTELKKAEENMEKLNAMLEYDYFCLYHDDNVNKDFYENDGDPDSAIKCKDFKIIYKIENKQEAIKKLKMLLSTNKYRL